MASKKKEPMNWDDSLKAVQEKLNVQTSAPSSETGAVPVAAQMKPNVEVKKKNPSTRSEPTPDFGAERFVFRDREWPTSELKNEFFALRDRMNELLDEKKKSRLSDEKWRELNLVQDGLEHIGPELERRERNKRKAKRSAERKSGEGKMTGDLNESSSGRDQRLDFLGSDPITDEFSISKAQKSIDTILPEGGKMTFLDEETLGMVAELMKIKSAFHNGRERIRKRRKRGDPLERDLEFLSAQQEKRKGIVSRLQQAYTELEMKLSETDESSAGTDRKAVRKRLMLSNAVKELYSIIGGINHDVKADEESLAEIRNDLDKVGTGKPDAIEQNTGKSDGALQPMTERQINEELKRLGWILAESQGPIEEFETEIEELKNGLAREKDRLKSLMEKKVDDPHSTDNSYIELLRGSIAESEANISRKEADLELRRHPDSIGERIRSLERERGERFPVGAKKTKKTKLEDLPTLTDDIDRLKRRAEDLRSELGLHEAYLEELGRERVTEAGRFEESLSKWSEQWKKIEDIKRVLTGVKSADAISARLEEEKPATTDSLKRIDTTIREITEKKRHAEEELSVLSEKIGSLVAIPDAGQDNPVLEEEKITSDDPVVQPEPVISETAVSVEEEPLIISDNLVIQSEPGREVNDGVPTGSEAFTDVTLSATVRERFDSFGISSAELASVDGFAELTEGQRLFVAEMLRQTAARKIEDRARDAVATKSGLLKSYHLAASRKDTAGQVLRGGMETYGEDLRQLAEGMKVSGLDVEEKDGKFDIRFLSIPEGSENDGLLVPEGASFNEAANRLSTIPHEWSLPGASKDERKRYKEAKSAYDEAYERLDGIVNRDRSLEDPKAYATLREENVALRIADNRVRLIQHLTAHPEVGKQLEKFERQNAFLAGMKSVVAERSGYFVGGAAGRAALVGTLGLLAAPIVAAVSGGIMGRRRAEESIAEQDRQARRGKESVTKAAPKEASGWFGKLLERPEAISREKLEAGRKLMVRASVPEAESGGDGRKRGLAERLDIINGRIANLSPDDEVSMNKELGALAARVAYVRKKLDSDQVNFGDGPEGIRSRVMLLEALSRSEMNLGVFTDADDSPERRVSLRFDRAYGKAQKDEDTRVADARERYRWFETKRGAVMAGTISLLGAGAMSAFHEVSATLQHAVGSGVKGGGNGVTEAFPHRGGATAADAAGTKRTFTPGTGSSHSQHEVLDGKVHEGPVKNSGIPQAPIEQAHNPNTPKGPGAAVETLKQVATEKTSKAAEVAGKTYVETTKSGDSVTTLARRALAEYVRENNLSGLTPEQKVFIEDYLQKKIARGGALRVGEKIGFTKDLLNEAFGRVKALDADQLQNLHRYAEQVGEFRTGSPSAQAIQTGSGGDVASVPKIPLSEPGLSDHAPKTTLAPAVAEDAASLAKGNPSTAVAEAATETGNQAGTFRDMVKSDAARDFLTDPNHIEPFRKAAAGTVRELFSTSAGGVNEKLFLKVGKMTSKGVFGDCLLAVADPEHMASMDGFDAEGVRRLGKFLIAARRAGIHPETGIGKTETFRVYIERVSVRLAERGMDPSKLIESVSDRDLDGFAGGALEAWRNQGTK